MKKSLDFLRLLTAPVVINSVSGKIPGVPMSICSKLCVIGLVIFASFCYAHGPHKEEQDSSAVERIEKSEDTGAAQEEIEEVSRVETSGSEAPSVIELIGSFHAAVVHFPIAWLVMLLLVDLSTFVLGRVKWRKWGMYILIGTVASFGPALITGFFTAYHISQGTGIYSLMVVHRNLNVVVAVLCAVALVLRLSSRNKAEGAGKWLYLGLIICSTLLIAVSGHIGGIMVYGEGFLPF